MPLLPDRLLYRLLLLLLILPVSTACAALNPVDDAATLEMENSGFMTEAISLQSTGTALHAQAEATIASGSTQIAVLNAVNRDLLATLEGFITPTPALVGQNEPDSIGLFPLVMSTGQPGGGAPVAAGTPGAGGTGDGITRYVPTGLTTAVRENDGCITSPQSVFSVDTPQIYVTFVAYTLPDGVPLRADWFNEGELVSTGSWTSDGAYDQLCVWFYITTADAAFIPGNWSVQLFADGQPISGALTFTLDADSMTDGG